MISTKKIIAAALGLAGLAAGSCALAQTAAPAAPGQARAQVEERRAVFKLIGANFRPLGAVLKGDAQYDATDAKKRIDRLVFLSGLLPEVFPESSNVGEPDSKAKPDVWSKRAEFDAAIKKFQTDLAALQTVNDRDPSGGAAFKTALGSVAQNCKACHDDYKLK